MNHPPIPPGCLAFAVVDGRLRFVCSAFCLNVDVEDTTDPLSRFIISAVAEVEWRKIAESFAAPTFSISTDVVEGQRIIDHVNATMFAAQWRTWGDAKP